MSLSRKALRWALALVLAFGMIPASVLTVFAAEDLTVTGAHVGSSAFDKEWVAADAAVGIQPITIQTPPRWINEPLYIDLESNVPNATYQLLIGGFPAGVTLDKNTGVISGTPTVTQTGYLNMRATNPDTGETCSFWLTLGVYDESAKPGITTESCQNGNVNKEYYQMLYQSSYAQGTYTYSISSGKLPDGLSIVNVGAFHAAITGTPTKAGTFNFTVKVESFLGSATKSYTITIGEELIKPAFSGDKLPDATRQSVYTVDLNDYLTGNYTKPINSWEIDQDDLDAVGGLTFDAATGILSGTPVNEGSYYLYVKAGNAGGTASNSFMLGVYDEPEITTAESARTAYVGEYFNWPMAATGSQGGWSVSKGSLPSGLHFSGDGVIWGDPEEAGTFNLTVRYEVSDELYAEKALVLTVSHTYKAYITQGDDYEFPSRIIGYDEASQLSVTIYNTGSGALGGLTAELSGPNADCFQVGGLSSTLAAESSDEFTVQPNVGLAAGDYSATITVKSGEAVYGSFDVSFSVGDELFAPSITSPYELPYAVEGEPWSYQFQASGTGPFTWTLNSIEADGADVSSYFTFDSATGLLTLTGTPSWDDSTQVSLDVTAENAVSRDSEYPYFSYYTLPKVGFTQSDYTTPYGSTYDNNYVGYSLKNEPRFNCNNDANCTAELEGTLPAGVELYSAGFWGDLDGAPTEPGAFVFRIKATKTVDGDVIGTAVSDYLTMTVYEMPKFQESHNLALPVLTATAPMDPIDLSAFVTGGKAPLTYSVSSNSSLPDGISLDADTGILSGTPTTAGQGVEYWPQFVVTDANGKNDTITFSTSACDRVQCPAPVISAGGDTFAVSMKVYLSCPDTSANVYYRTDGGTPTDSTATFAPGVGGELTITEDMADENGVVTLTAVAYANGQPSEAVTKTFTVVDKPAAVTADPVSGTEFGGSLQVELACSTAGSAIYYSTDPSLDTAMELFLGGEKYSAPIIVTASTTLRAVSMLRVDATTTVMGDVSTFAYTRNDRFGFELDKTELSFTAEEGYVSVASQTIAVENTGNVASAPLAVTLSGDGMGAFDLSSSTVNSMYPGDIRTVAVTPKAGMPAGTYTATLTLDNGAVDPMTVSLSFEVAEKPVVHTVLFWLDPSDEYAIAWREVEDGQTAEPQADPAQEGKVFLGWYTDPVGGVKFDFSTPITGDLNLYARFEAVPETGDGGWVRLAGSNRFLTAQAIAQEGFSGTGGVAVIATGLNYADALAATGLAGVYGAPVLLTMPGYLSTEAAEELERLAPSKVIVVGGAGVVSDAVIAEVETMLPGVDVDRVWGDNRFDTAVAVYEYVNDDPNASWSGDVVLATGLSFADALAVSPYAYWSGTPILLVNPGQGLGAEAASVVLAANADDELGRVIVVGGVGCVSEAAYAQLEAAHGSDEVLRLAGDNRFATGVEVAKFAASEGMSYDGAGVATGMDFPDALAGAALCGVQGSVLLLVNGAGANLGPVGELLAANASAIDGGYVFGGEGVVTPAIVAMLAQAIA